MTTATQNKGVGKRGSKTLVPTPIDVTKDPAFAKFQAAVQADELNDAAKKIAKFKQFADAKKSTGAESGCIVDGKRIPFDMMDAASKILREAGGEPPRYEDFVIMGTSTPPQIMGTSTVSDWPGKVYEPLPPPPYVPYARLKHVLREAAYYALATILVIGMLAFVGFVL
jgi:hypothetical protein